MIKKILILLLLFNLLNIAHAAFKDEIISNLEKTNNLSFNFKQTINEKIEEGNCIIEYPKKFIAHTII